MFEGLLIEGGLRWCVKRVFQHLHVLAWGGGYLEGVR